MRYLAAPLLAVILVSCEGLRSSEPETTVIAPPQPIPTGEEMRPPALEMFAHANGNAVRFQIRNNSIEQLYIGPRNLGIITVGQEEILHADDERVVARFHPVTLRPGEECAGELIVPSFDTLVGRRLVFYSHQVEPPHWRADILPEPPPLETQAPTAP
ncbi:hypothetical protein JXA47_03795 [Candidatus Sumerlaeota bacterium]|nr:hypothetical protein [Candidatus Sumerlaeota bacterium]